MRDRDPWSTTSFLPSAAGFIVLSHPLDDLLEVICLATLNHQARNRSCGRLAFTRSMVEGKRVRLELDQSNAARGHKDNTPQKRTLAYVFLEDGTLLNAEIIKRTMVGVNQKLKGCDLRPSRRSAL
jgi:hypothetical protein